MRADPAQLARMSAARFRALAPEDLAEFADANTRGLCGGASADDLIDMLNDVDFTEGPAAATRQDVANFAYVWARLRHTHWQKAADVHQAYGAAEILIDIVEHLQATC